MSSTTLYQELASPVSGDVAPDRTEVTLVETETIDRDRAVQTRDTRFLQPPQVLRSADPGRTEQTATVETIDRDRHPVGCLSQLTEGSLYEVVSRPVDASAPGRTEFTKAEGETVDRDHHAFASACQLTGDRDLYTALSHPASAKVDRGRTEITTATETVDWDRPPGALGA